MNKLNIIKVNFKDKEIKILAEDDFIEYFLVKKVSRTQAKDYSIGRVLYYNTKNYYKTTSYGDQLYKIKSENYSKALLGNTRGKKKEELPITRESLDALLKRKLPLETIARLLDTSLYYVTKAIKEYNLEYIPIEDRNLRSKEYLENRDQNLFKVFPDLETVFLNYTKNPLEFFEELYLVHLELIDLQEQLSKYSSRFSWFRETNKIEKNHICWSKNIYEAKLSRALLKENIPHIRCFYFPKSNYSFDFCLTEIKVLIEIDGEYHIKNKTTIESDKHKELLAKDNQYTILRYSTKYLLKNLNSIIEDIKCLLNRK